MCCVLLGTCDGGIFTYEKTTGHFLRTAQQDPLDLQGQKMPGITVRCSNACSDLGSECPAFTVDYSGQRCFKLDRYGRFRRCPSSFLCNFLECWDTTNV